jgi:hypothetical protein
VIFCSQQPADIPVTDSIYVLLPTLIMKLPNMKNRMLILTPLKVLDHWCQKLSLRCKSLAA